MQRGWSPGWRLLWLKVFLRLVQRPVTTEDSNSPGLAVELVRMWSSIFYHGFCYGKLDDQPVEDAQRRAFAARGGGGGLPYITDGDARRKFQKKPLKVTILGVAPANFIP